MTLSTKVTWYGVTLTRADMEAVLAKGDPAPDAPISVRVAPTSNHPTDPGGEITISMEGAS